MIIDADDMLLSNLKELYEISEKNNKDINDFSYLRGTFNNFNEIRVRNREYYQPDIGEMIFAHNYIGSTFIAKKIMKSKIIKDAVRTIKDEYLNSHIVIHCDTFLFICIFYYVQSYKSYNNLFSQFHIKTGSSASHKMINKYNELFRVTVYLAKYVSELKYDSELIYNQHVKFSIGIFNWPLSLCGNRKLIVDWNKLNEFTNGILNNKDLNEKNKNKLYKILGIIKNKSNHK